MQRSLDGARPVASSKYEVGYQPKKGSSESG